MVLVPAVSADIHKGLVMVSALR